MNRLKGLKAHIRRTAGLALAFMLGAGALAVPAMAEDGAVAALDITRPVTLVVEPQYLDTTLEKITLGDGLLFDVYQIAEAKKLDGFDTYKLELCSGFTNDNLGVTDINADDINLDTWNAVSQSAADIILNNKGEGGVEILPVLSGGKVTTPGGPVNLATLPVNAKNHETGGLYLLVMRGNSTEKSSYMEPGTTPITTFVDSDTTTYKFLPILFAAPSKTTKQDTIFDTSAEGGWYYDRTFQLKGETERRKGSLRIVKDLKPYEERAWAFDPATFVYQIEGKLANSDGTETTIYSNVKSIVFDGKNEPDPIDLFDLPAGAKFTITEIYQGENYEPDKDAPVTPAEMPVIIKADPRGTPPKTISDQTVIVTFKNVWDKTYHGGGSIDNLYKDRKYQGSDAHNGKVVE